MYEELRAIQRQYGYLPADQLRALSGKIKVHLSQIHAVASFYPHFHLTPPPKVDMRVCSDMSCHLLGADDIKAGLERQFRGASDKDVTIREVSCLGRCDQGPAVMLNDAIYADMDTQGAIAMALDAMAGRPLPHPKHKHGRTPAACDPYNGTGQYSVVKKFVEDRDWQGVLNKLQAGKLRGMGGAGFPTFKKWELVRKENSATKYIVCNADESEPGTIKDRHIMENVPYLVFEGMILAGLVTGAHKGILYIRHEYENAKEILQEELDRAYKLGVVGPRVMGSDLSFDLEIFVSPGGYICGEESALIEAIEGHRAEPRNKPPFPGQVGGGLWGQPTVVNNVETFSLATVILARGLDWYQAQGKNGAIGVKFVGISGDVVRPGVFEVPMGVTYTELLFEYAGGITGGRKLLGFAPSGPSSGYLPASMAELPLDWDKVAAAGSMVGSGAIVVCAEGRCMLDMALNSTRFYRNESCGKCVPCRMGSQKMVDMLKGWTEGRSSKDDMKVLTELSTAMNLASICGLGQIVPAPIQSILKHFPEVVDDHLIRRHCPGGVCFSQAGMQ